MTATTLLAMALSGLFFGAGENGEQEEVTSEVRELAESNNAFALKLYGQLAREDDGNLLISPLSVSTAMSMAYAGARGETAREMASVLSFEQEQAKVHEAFKRLLARYQPHPEREGWRMLAANAIWAGKNAQLLDQYVSTMTDQYHAAAREVDFAQPQQACGQINGWVSEQTRDKIDQLIQPEAIKPSTFLVLTNAVYFKGDWLSKFETKHTEKQPFLVSPSRTVEVPLMAQKAVFPFARVEGLKLLELPYVGEELSMVVLLPEDKTGTSSLDERLSPERLAQWLDRLGREEVMVYLPRFEMRGGYELSEPLQALGMKRAFHRADFSGMTRAGGVIDRVIHKTYVQVNEEGTEAAAATGVTVTRVSMPEVFRADHPFLFLIRDRVTGAILFMGRVTDPSG